MNALLLIAHGSRNTAANREIDQLALNVADCCGGSFHAVQHAFLEFAEPDIVDGVRQCVDRGATRVTVVPYFLTAGKHVVRDIPEQLDIARAAHADVDIDLSPHVGALDVMASLVAQCAEH